MTDIGVFRSNNGNYFTCCCRVVIPNDYTNCPRCKQRLIPISERYEFTLGVEYKALKGRVEASYIESGRAQAGIVAARLRGEIFVMPNLCLSCGEPEPGCNCVLTEWEE